METEQTKSELEQKAKASQTAEQTTQSSNTDDRILAQMKDTEQKIDAKMLELDKKAIELKELARRAELGGRGLLQKQETPEETESKEANERADKMLKSMGYKPMYSATVR
jgi:hypothetical protein